MEMLDLLMGYDIDMDISIDHTIIFLFCLGFGVCRFLVCAHRTIRARVLYRVFLLLFWSLAGF